MRRMTLAGIVSVAALVLAGILSGHSAAHAATVSAGLSSRTVHVSAVDVPSVPQPGCPCTYQWRVWSVASPYYTQGSWFDCVNVDNDGYNPASGCNDSYAVANGVTGTVTVSDGTISSAVGFNVTLTFTRGSSYSLAPGKDWYGVYQAASVYLTKKVTERLGYCYSTGACTWTNNWATAYAHRWNDFTYRVVARGDD